MEDYGPSENELVEEEVDNGKKKKKKNISFMVRRVKTKKNKKIM